MIRDLTAKEQEFLVKYCMQPENTWLALAIGQIQPLLQKEIKEVVAYFAGELDKSVRKELEACSLHWETCVSATNLDLEKDESEIYSMSMKDQAIEIQLCYEKKKESLFVGIPANKALPPADALRESFRDDGLKDSQEDDNDKWPWWIYLEETHKSAEALIATRYDDHLRGEKIEYFTNELVRIAKAISKALRA